ncbi:hypothetical protein [Streptomyces sp. NBC_00140]|uniref:hypothetical protein n=1 Tax=Streptomyces sp. NBC_00140 TaxID=2975664 RepID=UPI00224F2E78|nr:hypothetical protein [Streptomyces sp. NBC_00140]MCX5336579.1 hypothetical protein [Streptomyces sp. NBC_00140]
MGIPNWPLTHWHHVGANARSQEIPTTGELLQIVVHAYRLAWQANDAIHVGST